jgi:hypothetical protein
MLNIQLFNNFAKQVGGGGNIAPGLILKDPYLILQFYLLVPFPTRNIYTKYT